MIVSPTTRRSARLTRNRSWSFSIIPVAVSPGANEMYRTSASSSYVYVGSIIASPPRDEIRCNDIVVRRRSSIRSITETKEHNDLDMRVVVDEVVEWQR